ncbi:MAG: hypothetical protein RR288_03070, partial [Oscillibacter sp.]
VALGAVLLLWPDGEKAAAGAGKQAESTLAELQTEMETILSKIGGVGQLQLMLTVEADSEKQLAQDTELSYRGATAAPEDYSRRSETVVVDGGGGNEAVVTKHLSPIYRGALVVCEGGDRADVQLAVTQAVAALTGLSSEKIVVIKWQ